MHLLTLLLLAVPTVVLAMDCEIDDPSFLAMEECKSVMKPPKDSLKIHATCIGQQKLGSFFSGLLPRGQRRMRPQMMDGPKVAMCFHSKYNNLTTQEKEDFSKCVLNGHEMLTADELMDVTKFLAEISAMIDEITIEGVKTVLQESVSTCPQPSETPDVGSILTFKKCLMKSCAQYALSLE